MDVLHPRAAPAVNGLVIIANGGDMSRAAGKNRARPWMALVSWVVNRELEKAALVVGKKGGILKPELAAKRTGEIHKPHKQGSRRLRRPSEAFH